MSRWLLTILILLNSVECLGQSIHVEWGYTPPSAPAVTGFKLYKEGAFACQWPDKDATAGDCDTPITKVTTGFTLTATFADGTESPHSAVFNFVMAASPVIKSIVLK